MGAAEITRFLTSLDVDRRVAASTQNQALTGLDGSAEHGRLHHHGVSQALEISRRPLQSMRSPAGQLHGSSRCVTVARRFRRIHVGQIGACDNDNDDPPKVL